MIKNALIIKHIGEERLGVFNRVFDQENISMRYAEAAHDDLDAIDPLEPDLLMVMGGPIGVYDAEHYPFLKSEIKILEKRIAADKPTLGICLGAQLIAAALGAKVYKGPAGDEVGWHPVTVNEAGMKTALAHLDASNTNMFHWHGDTFDLPENAELLASSGKYRHQAFRYGENVMALQFHPEVTERMLKEWFILYVDQLTGPNPVVPIAEMRRLTTEHIPVMNEQSQKFFRDWLRERKL